MSKKTILIVDDSEFDRKLLVKALERKGDFMALEASNGDECLALLANSFIDIILMDIMMPGTSGKELLQKIRSKYNAVELPVIMVSAKSDASDVIECLQAGANDYVTKPVNFDITVSRILMQLQLAEMSQEMLRLKEMAALDAMISTYNHEINNPLTIAISCVNNLDAVGNTKKEELSNALWRIAEIVKKIRAVTEKKEVEYQDYGAVSKMVKLR